MADYTVSVTQPPVTYITVENPTPAGVTIEDIINSVTVSQTDANNVTVVASTFIDGAGGASRLFYSNGAPSNTLGSAGDFYVDVSSGKLWGPKGESVWPDTALALIPKRNVYIQEASSASWNISHNLDGFPSVTVVDSAGTVVVGEVTYNSTSSITVTFQSAFSGKAYLT